MISSKNSFLAAVGFSVGGCVVFVLALFLVWRRIKKNYVHDFGDAKPEVNSQ